MINEKMETYRDSTFSNTVTTRKDSTLLTHPVIRGFVEYERHIIVERRSENPGYSEQEWEAIMMGGIFAYRG